MFPLSPMTWVYAGVAILVVALGTGLKIQTSRLDAVKTEYATFKAEVKVIGEQAAIKAKATEVKDIKDKEKADASNKVLRTANATLSHQLRNARASSSFVPTAAPGSPEPDRAIVSR